MRSELGSRESAPRRSGGRLSGWLLVAVGAALLSHAVAARARGTVWQAMHRRALEATDHQALRPAVPARPHVPRPQPVVGEAVARLRIARVGLDAVVIEGVGRDSLTLGPGHLSGSALPGQPENCVIAGHRDGAFARLGSVEIGDVVDVGVEGERGVARYRVCSIEVLDAGDTRPLAPAGRPMITLVTCYPIHSIGPAAKRLVVRGEPAPPAATS
jgi:sortase A